MFGLFLRQKEQSSNSMQQSRKSLALQRQQSFDFFSVLLLFSIIANITLGSLYWRTARSSGTDTGSGLNSSQFKSYILPYRSWFDGGFKISLGVSLLILGKLLALTFQDSYSQPKKRSLIPLSSTTTDPSVNSTNPNSTNSSSSTRKRNVLATMPNELKTATRKFLLHAQQQKELANKTKTN